jgi:hypothetical protein
MIEVERLIKAIIGVKSALRALDDIFDEMLRNQALLDESEEQTCCRFTSPVSSVSDSKIEKGSRSAAYDDVERVLLYVLGCAGCLRLSKDYGHPVYKLGITNDPDFDRRLSELQGDNYGGTIRIGNAVVTEPGFEKWVPLAIATSGHTSDPGIEILPRAIAIELPCGMTARSFDATLRKALEARAVHRRVYPGKPDRLTAYVTGGNKEKARVSRASELYEFAPRDKREGDFLLRIIEIILRDHRKGKK